MSPLKKPVRLWPARGPVSGGGDEGSGLVPAGSQQLLGGRDHDAFASRIEKADGRFDLRPHASRREMTVLPVLPGLGDRQMVQVDLVRLTVVERDLLLRAL